MHLNYEYRADTSSYSRTITENVNVCVRTYPPYVMPVVSNPLPRLDILRNASVNNANITGESQYFVARLERLRPGSMKNAHLNLWL